MRVTVSPNSSPVCSAHRLSTNPSRRIARTAAWAGALALALLGLHSSGSRAAAFATPVVRAACTAAELAPFAGPGKANLEGHIDDPKTAAVQASGYRPGARVLVEIFPAVPCIDSWWNNPASHAFERGVPLTQYPPRDEDPQFQKALRTTFTDDNGDFAVYGIPAGTYWLRLPWLIAHPGAYTVKVDGEFIKEKVDLKNGTTAKVLLRVPEPKK
jgi:hypothetical protein